MTMKIITAFNVLLPAQTVSTIALSSACHVLKDTTKNNLISVMHAFKDVSSVIPPLLAHNVMSHNTGSSAILQPVPAKKDTIHLKHNA